MSPRAFRIFNIIVLVLTATILASIIGYGFYRQHHNGDDLWMDEWVP